MSERPDGPPVLNRRRFLGTTFTFVCAAPVLGAGCGPAPAPTPVDAGLLPIDAGSLWPLPQDTVLSPARYETLVAAMDAIIPGDPSSPGATIANAAWYLDQLLGAFSTDPPRIFAGGPTSGRHGGADDFARFQPLTRLEELRWRTFIEGSRGLPEREWNGPVVGLVERCETGLDALDGAARSGRGAAFAALSLRARAAVLDAADETFVALLYEHAAVGTYGDPAYGGNDGQSGWRSIDYEGDRQPIGYTARQMSHPEEG